jgi:hypothetical protein
MGGKCPLGGFDREKGKGKRAQAKGREGLIHLDWGEKRDIIA